MIAPASGWPTGYVDSSDTLRSAHLFTHVGWRDVRVPLATWYRPLSMAAGIVSLDLMLAVWVSTQLWPRIGYTWRRLHGLTFAVYLLSTLRGLGVGTGTRQPWALYAGPVTETNTRLLLSDCRCSVIERSSSYHRAVMGTPYAGDGVMSGLEGERGDSDMAVTTALPRGRGRTAGRVTCHGHAIRGPPASAAAIGPRRAHEAFSCDGPSARLRGRDQQQTQRRHTVRTERNGPCFDDLRGHLCSQEGSLRAAHSSPPSVQESTPLRRWPVPLTPCPPRCS